MAVEVLTVSLAFKWLVAKQIPNRAFEWFMITLTLKGSVAKEQGEQESKECRRQGEQKSRKSRRERDLESRRAEEQESRRREGE